MNNYSEIAIIGISCRFPGAKNVDEFWQNLRNGVESISHFDKQTLLTAGIDETLLDNPNYIKANGVLSDVEKFDANFFDFNTREAQRMDPQHRLFLEHAWEAIENAGYDTQTYDGSIGVYAGTDPSSYLLQNLDYDSDPEYFFQKFLLTNDKDYLPTRVSYKLNLKGPSVSVQTACSTSLVAVHMASQSLLNGECDMALAGGVSIRVPQKAGYFYQAGSVTSPDGHCRTFDAKAQGTVFGSGVGIVVLKRLPDAIADGDYIHAVIKGSAVNNDGSLKLSYTAPSVDGQTAVISEAQSVAEVDPETIGYVEAHGTATDLGDPIEVTALTQAFQTGTQRTGFCAIGAVKTNFGHLGAAAGVASLIKTVLALKHKQIPPSLNFEQPNPKIDFDNSPFYVNDKLSDWEANGTPRRAGVSSFGIGGTNAHMVLEEAPLAEASEPSCRPWQLLALSAKTSSALEKATANLAQYLKQHSNLNLADVAYTLQMGRQAFEHRRMVVCQSLEDAVIALESPESQKPNSQRKFTRHQPSCNRPVVFMFSGQGTQYVNMARDLYEVEENFRETVDHCSDLLVPHLKLDLRQILYPGPERAESAAQQLKQTAIAQPALFVIEYALAQLWIKWGVEPTAAIGHSIGEYVAATLSGVFSLEDALALVTVRGRLMQQLPPGSMLAVSLSEEELRPLLGESLSIAAVNAPSVCTVSGPTPVIEALQTQLDNQEVDYRPLHTSHAFHSEMMEPMLASFTERVKQVCPRPPQLPYISNVTGTWITSQEATSPDYWATHIRQTVRFSQGLQELFKEPNQVLLEVGPGKALSKLTKRHRDQMQAQVVLNSVRHPREQRSDAAFLLNTLGHLWLAGVTVDWAAFYDCQQPRRLPLPTYPFDHQHYWIHSQKQSGQGQLYQSLPSAASLWKSLVNAGRRQTDAGFADIDEQTYLSNRQGLDRLCTAYINQALSQLGLFQHSSDSYSIEQLIEQCQVTPRYQQLLARWLQILVEQGQLQQDGALFSNFIPLPESSMDDLAKDVKVQWLDTPVLVDLAQGCGENLASIVIGGKEPLEIFNALIYQKEGVNSNPNVPWFNYYKSILRTSLEQVTKRLPNGMKLRILEIGAGMGVTTTEILPILPSQQTSYTFTDVGGSFLSQARRKFSDYPFVEYRVLDIETSPQEQGYESHSFDVVIASNVLHVTRNMEETLQHVRSLLAPEGLLLLWETTKPQLDFDITWGLLMNPLEDRERSQGNPFLSTDQWQKMLLKHGFVEAEALSKTEAFGQHIILARASESTAQPSAFSTLTEQRKSELSSAAPGKKSDIADWFYMPSWKRSAPPELGQSTIEAIKGCWLVFVDDCGWGEQIVERLTLAGQVVVSVRAGEHFSRENESPQLYTINPCQQNDYDGLLNDLHTLDLTLKGIVHLWSLTPDDEAKSRLEDVDKIQQRGFYSLVLLAQSLGKQSLKAELKVTVISNAMQAVTGEEVLCPEKATLLGAVRAIPQEYSNISCHSIDVLLPSMGSWQAEKLLAQILTELMASSSDSVVAYRGNHRWLPTFESVKLESAKGELSRLKSRGVYLLTGGLGGIGLFLASHLAKTVQAKLVLVGRSDFPPRSQWAEWLSTHDDNDGTSRKIKQLIELEELGSEILVISADVTDLQQMHKAVAQVQQQFGSINGVIHAAGVPGGGMVQRTSLNELESTLAPKVRGTLVLNELLKDTQLDFFVLCSSLSSTLGTSQDLGGFGQVSYCSANSFLDAFAHYKAATDQSFTLCINWDVWRGVGMAVDVENQIFRTHGIHQPVSITHPLFDQCLATESGQTIYLTTFSVDKHWVLNEHRVLDKATLPGTVYLEMALAAGESQFGSTGIEVRNVYFLNPLTLEDDEEREVRTLLKQQDDGYVFSIASKVDPGLGYWQEHARGEIVCLETQQSKAYAIQEIEAECDQHEIVMADSEPNAQPGSVGLGARWQNCRWIKLGAEQGLAFLELPEVFADDLTLYKLHPALLGIATSFLTKQSNHDAIYLPFTFKQLKVNAPLPARFYSHIRAVKNSSLNGEAQTFNITIMDERGIGIVEIEDYILRKVSKDKTASMEANKADVASNAANLSTADARALFETADSKNQSQGDIFKDWLLPSEGIEVFSRALENPLSQVLVSAVELRDRGDQTQKLQPVVSLPEVFEETKPSDAAQLRPDLSHPYAAPKNEIEQQLITIWEGILGIKQIGIQDNFFELGGDSLVAIQVISQIRKTFQIEPPISLIFDKPRVADLAEYIERTRKIAEKLQTPDNDVHLQKREEIEL